MEITVTYVGMSWWKWGIVGYIFITFLLVARGVNKMRKDGNRELDGEEPLLYLCMPYMWPISYPVMWAIERIERKKRAIKDKKSN